MNEGDLVFVNYGEVPMCIHTRLLGAHIQDDIWVVITPDKDIYEEELHTRNPDLVAVFHGGGGFGSPVPAGVSRRHLYSFAPMSAQDYQNLMQAARTYAAQLRVHLGLPPPGLVVPPPVPAPGGPPPPAVNDDPEVWISLEQDHGHVIGEVIIAAGLPLPTRTCESWAQQSSFANGGQPSPCSKKGPAESDHVHGGQGSSSHATMF